jgi:hypothetical protein
MRLSTYPAARRTLAIAAVSVAMTAFSTSAFATFTNCQEQQIAVAPKQVKEVVGTSSGGPAHKVQFGNVGCGPAGTCVPESLSESVGGLVYGMVTYTFPDIDQYRKGYLTGFNWHTWTPVYKYGPWKEGTCN